VAKSKRAEARTKKVEPLERIANLLALLLVKDSKPSEAILQLWRAGFPDEEIADMLNTTLGNIRQTRYMALKKKPE
jgi:DNA-directed RNA polymerase specialized sigma24 family protein